jgi:hypothetical protein
LARLNPWRQSARLDRSVPSGLSRQLALWVQLDPWVRLAQFHLLALLAPSVQSARLGQFHLLALLAPSVRSARLGQFHLLALLAPSVQSAQLGQWPQLDLSDLSVRWARSGQWVRSRPLVRLGLSALWVRSVRLHP